MFTYKLTLCKRHSEQPKRCMFDELDHFYSVDFDTPHALVDNLLRSEAQLLKNDMCALVTRHYKEKDRMLVILEKGYHKGYGIFHLSEKGFHEVKSRINIGGGIGRGTNSRSNDRLQITFTDCTAYYISATNYSENQIRAWEDELKEIERVHGVPKFDSGEIVHSRRFVSNWIEYIDRGFSAKKSITSMHYELNARDAFFSKDMPKE